MAANSHTTAEYAATNTVPKNTAPMSHDTTNTTGAGRSRNLAYALAMGPADVRARARCSAPGAAVRRCWLLLTPRRIDKTDHRLCLFRGSWLRHWLCLLLKRPSKERASKPLLLLRKFSLY